MAAWLIMLSAGIVSAQQHYTQKFTTIRNAVFNHYACPVDSLKLRAAKFILDNMYERKYMMNSQIKSLISRIDTIQMSQDKNNYKFINAAIDSFYERYNEPHYVYEYNEVSADDIIAEIDDAFQTRQKYGFGQHLDFEEFCEYILSPVIGNTYYTPWRTAYRKMFNKSLERLLLADDRRHSAFQAAGKINYAIRHNVISIKQIELPFGICYPADKLINMRTGSCRAFALKAAYSMRAFGIPVNVDFTPQWPNRFGGHYWNSVVSDHGFSVPFSGAQTDPGQSFYPESPMAKVYRMTYASQPNSLASIVKGQKAKTTIPQTLRSPYMKDVTEEYVKTSEFSVNTGNVAKDGDIVYVSVFNNHVWIPVDYAIVAGEKATFKNMGRNVVYLPTLVDSQEEGFTSPIEITALGNIHVIEPDMSKKQAITMSRKYPVMSGILGYSERMVGGYIEASNSETFLADSTFEMGEITRFPAMTWSSIKLKQSNKKYRYWRYVSPKAGWCDVAEIEFISNNKPLNGERIIANVVRTDSHKPEAAFDGKPLTYFESNKANVGWIGLDFGKPVSIDSFRYLPRNDDNAVVQGHEYELDVYVHGIPETVSKIVSNGTEVTFRNVPVGGLYILHDRTAGKEERIFTYEKGEVIWH